MSLGLSFLLLFQRTEACKEAWIWSVRSIRRASLTLPSNANTIALEGNVKDARRILRTLHIHASLHASVRWNKSRKLKPNDILDFHHAAAALAYCDAFFTERSVRNIATQHHIALDKL